ncbi:hypothetical protein CP973_26685 [Streptomyces albofaciens JCM 4342]|uniref:S46 family peptidase n=1 Tax=Streptomyces albofaciens TaxID=66866 RepID=UPI00123A8D06|nr:S46 family peptidase [Streptomyces albofaciens]KAA6212911.1 hypothetical protein CP973_26685 [Streptomyces albofaciens JCM 4342]
MAPDPRDRAAAAARPAAACADTLLAALEPLPYPRRMAELAARAREAAGRGTLAGLLAEWDTRGPYERRLAAFAARVTGGFGYLAARLTDPDPLVRAHALRAVRTGALPDAAVEAAYADAPADVRRGLTRAVVAGGRPALAERLIAALRERWGDAEAAGLLPGCGPEAVARLLPELFHAAAASSRALAKRHPAAVLAEAERQLTPMSQASRAVWWQRYGACVAVAADREPLRVLGLLERMCRGPLAGPLLLRLDALVAADPGRTLRLLLEPGRDAARTVRFGPSTLRRLVRADPPELIGMGRALRNDEAALAGLLRALPPARRAAFHDSVTAGLGTGRVPPCAPVLDALPRARREAEARRAVALLREDGAHRSAVLEAVAYLPVAEARADLLAATRRPAAEDRAAAYPLLIHNAARSGDPDAVTALLADGLTRLRNEQDPVRRAALDALAGVRPALFTDAAADALERLATDTGEARDTSPASRDALVRLAVSLLREHAATGQRELTGWALRTLARLAGRADTGLGRLDRDLRPGQEHQVFAALRPWLEARAERADHDPVVALASSLGRRAHGVPGLQELLRRAVRTGDDRAVRAAVGPWLEPPGTRDARLAEILDLDASAAVLPPVLDLITRHRTDLLHLVLGAPPYGRFLTPGTHWTPPVTGRAHRWTARQQDAAARLLERAADDPRLRPDERAAAITDAARLPGRGAALVRRCVTHPDVPLAEAALAALARTGRPDEALPELLAHAGGDRARVAVYAAGVAARYAAPSRLAAALRAVLVPGGAAPGRGAAGAQPKVTSRKEAARLAAARLPVPDAAELLVRAYHQPEQHRDVRAACATAATGLLADERAWGLLSEAARGPRGDRQAVLRVRPLDLPEQHRARYAGLVRAVCETDDAELAGEAYRALGAWSRWAPDAAGLLVLVLTDLDNRATWQEAADALLVLAAEGPLPGHGPGGPVPHGAAEAEDPLARAARLLAAADARPGTPDAETRRDRPARQRLGHLTARLDACRLREPALRTSALVVGQLLADYPDFVPYAVRVLSCALDLGADAEEMTVQLTRLARLHTDRPALARHTADTLRHRLNGAHGPDRTTAAEAAARALTEDGGPAAGLFAVALTAFGGTRTEWSAPWRERLRALRRHPVPDVRDAALELTAARE